MTAPVRMRDTRPGMLRHRTGSGYRAPVPPIERKIPQHTFALEDALWKRCRRIALLRHETMSEVIRQHLVRYEAKYRHLLDDVD